MAFPLIQNSFLFRWELYDPLWDSALLVNLKGGALPIRQNSREVVVAQVECVSPEERGREHFSVGTI